MSNTSSQKLEKAIVFSTPTCMFCHALMDFLDSEGVEYEEVDVSNPIIAAQVAEKLGHDIEGVPITLFYGEEILGFNRPAIKKLIKEHQNQ